MLKRYGTPGLCKKRFVSLKVCFRCEDSFNVAFQENNDYIYVYACGGMFLGLGVYYLCQLTLFVQTQFTHPRKKYSYRYLPYLRNPRHKLYRRCVLYKCFSVYNRKSCVLTTTSSLLIGTFCDNLFVRSNTRYYTRCCAVCLVIMRIAHISVCSICG